MAIPKARDLSTVARLKQVAKYHFRGWSPARIAREMDCDQRTVAKDIAQITSQTRELDNVGAYLNDLIARTGEQIVQLDEIAAEQWKLLDWCTEEVVQVDAFGNPLSELDPQTGQVQKVNGYPKPQLGPRKPGMIPTVTAQLQKTLEQRAQLLKLIGPKVDISVKLQVQEQTQARILEAIATAAPELYGQLYKELQIIAETAEQQFSLPPGTAEAIEVEFTDVSDAG